MTGETDPLKLVEWFFGCSPRDIGEMVVLTFGERLIGEVRQRIEITKELEGFLKGFT